MVVSLSAGLILLIVGAEALVRGASKIAAALGISPLIIGLTVVAFGTSAPEMAVSIGSSLGGQADLALGNVVGSNIFNVLFILGAAALVAPLVVSSQLVRWDVPLGIGVSVFTLVLAANGVIGRGEGALLVGGLLAYTAVLIVQGQPERPSRPDSDTSQTEIPTEHDEQWSPALRWGLHLGLAIGGLALLVLGARWFVDGAVHAARRLGINELVIGLTIVAGGTSLPELATSVLAAVRGERDIAVGNVVGSNLFNLLGVLGLSAMVSPTGVAVSPTAFWFDLPVMIAVSVACLPIFFTGHEIARWEGGLFLGYYGAYVTYLVLAATHHTALSAFNWTMVAFALPITAVTLAVLGLRAGRGNA